jgi:CBS domain-containing protein
MATCKDVMTRDPACCQPGDSVVDVASIMKQQDVGSVPVVESRENRRLVGIVTDRDLVVKVLAGRRAVEHATVNDAMTANPVCCREADEIGHVLDLMKDRQVRRMPIVDGAGRLVGIIAQADIATRVNRDHQTGELVEAISESGSARR